MKGYALNYKIKRQKITSVKTTAYNLLKLKTESKMIVKLINFKMCNEELN